MSLVRCIIIISSGRDSYRCQLADSSFDRVMISKTNMNFKYLDIKHCVNQATGIVCMFIGYHFSNFAQSCNGPDRCFAGVEYIKWQHRLWAVAFHHPVTRTPTMVFHAAKATLVWAEDAAGGVHLSPVCVPTAAQAVRQNEHCAASKCCMRAAFQHSWFDFHPEAGRHR